MKITKEDATYTEIVGKKQKELDFTDSAMAKFLGMSRSLYRDTQAGVRPVGMTYVSAIIDMFPDLIPATIIFLRDKHCNSLRILDAI